MDWGNHPHNQKSLIQPVNVDKWIGVTGNYPKNQPYFEGFFDDSFLGDSPLLGGEKKVTEDSAHSAPAIWMFTDVFM